MLTETSFAVLNAVYLKKMATVNTISVITSLPVGTVAQSLDDAQAQGWIMTLPTGAMLLEDGTAAVLAYYRDTYASVRALPEVQAWYEAFEAVNAKFIAQVTAWQQSEGDDRAERRLLQTAERLTRDIGALQAHVPRYEAYVRRFTASMDRVDSGQREFVCSPTIDSVHNIWFEFHEDILAVLGRPRDTT